MSYSCQCFITKMFFQNFLLQTNAAFKFTCTTLVTFGNNLAVSSEKSHLDTCLGWDPSCSFGGGRSLIVTNGGLLQSHYPLRTSVPPFLLALLLPLESVGLVSGSPSPVSATSAKFPSWTHSKKSRATADCSGRPLPPLPPPHMLHDMSPQLSSVQLKVERSFFVE